MPKLRLWNVPLRPWAEQVNAIYEVLTTVRTDVPYVLGRETRDAQDANTDASCSTATPTGD